MSNSYQSEIPKARVNIQLSVHTGGAQKKVELPLKLMVVGDYSNGAEQRPVSEREKVNVNKTTSTACCPNSLPPSIFPLRTRWPVTAAKKTSASPLLR